MASVGPEFSGAGDADAVSAGQQEELASADEAAGIGDDSGSAEMGARQEVAASFGSAQLQAVSAAGG